MCILSKWMYRLKNIYRIERLRQRLIFRPKKRFNEIVTRSMKFATPSIIDLCQEVKKESMNHDIILYMLSKSLFVSLEAEILFYLLEIFHLFIRISKFKSVKEIYHNKD